MLWLRQAVGILLAFPIFVSFTDAQCTLPMELRGNWTSSREGALTFDSTSMSGYLACKAGGSATSCNVLPTDWTCLENSGDRYLLRSTELTGIYLYVCLYLDRISSTKFVYYQGPNDLQTTLNDYVMAITISSSVSIDMVCNLAIPIPVDRYHVLVLTESIPSSASFCPTELLGNFINDQVAPCNFSLNACADKESLEVSNSTCSPRPFWSENGSLSCLYSLNDVITNTTYVTLYNKDLTVDDVNTFRFLCVALHQSKGQILTKAQNRDCISLASPTVASPDYTLNATLLCPITCQFAPSLSGSWTSTRKGQVGFHGDTMTEFEPTGLDCLSVTCSSAPTTFECYMTSGSKYLVRTEPLQVNSAAVRIYVCLDFTAVTATKLIYYHDHDELHSDFQDYVVTLNAASPVDAMSDVCENIVPYDPALNSVLVRADSIADNLISCPSQFDEVYNTTDAACDFTLSACDDDQQVRLSNTGCAASTPFYTGGGVLSCLHSTTSGNTTFLTLYNQDTNYTTNGVHQFSCLALEKQGNNLVFSQTPFGCHEGQTPTYVTGTDSAIFTFVSLGDCPTDDRDESAFPWYIVIAAILSLILILIILVILWSCCCEPRLRIRKQTDEEYVVGEPDEEAGKKRKRRVKAAKEGQEESVEGDSSGSLDLEDESPGLSDRRFRDVFTVGPSKQAIVRGKEKMKKEEKDDDDNEEGWETFVESGEETEAEHRQKRKKKKRKKHKKGRKDEKALRQETEVEEEHSASSDDSSSSDDRSEYSQSFESSDEYSQNFDSDASEDSLKRRKELFGSRYNLHVAKAWQQRTFNPHWVKDDSVPKSREELEPVQRGSLHQLHSGGYPVALGDVFRKHRKLRQDSCSISSIASGSLPCGSFSPVRKMPPLHHNMEAARLGFAREIPYIDLYLSYTEKRLQMMDEGFWDDDNATKMAEEYFGFMELEAKLNTLDALEKDLQSQPGDQMPLALSPALSRLSASPGQSAKGGRRSTMPVANDDHDQAQAQAKDPDHDTGIDSRSQSNVSVQIHADVPGTDRVPVNLRKASMREVKSAKTPDSGTKSPSKEERVTFKGASQMMARLYARLHELRNAKDDDTATTFSDNAARHRDRRRIKTALRRLLTERLFPDQRVCVKSKKDQNGAETESQRKDDPLVSGTVTPMTLGSRSKTAFSLRSRTEMETRDGSRSGLKGRVVFVGENSQTTESETDGDITNPRSPSARDGREETPGYYRRHLGPVRNPNNISRLYQPARSPSRLSKATMEGIHKDQAFLDKLKADNKASEDVMTHQNGSKTPNDEITRSSRDVKSDKHPEMNWTYNIQTRSQRSQRSSGHSASSRKLKDLDDGELKNLLEELYRDKKYMDRVINTHNDNDIEEGVAISLEQSREYLLQRAMYWQEQGPPPHRPPTTELGLRLEREQSTMTNRSTKGTNKGNNRDNSNVESVASSSSDVPLNVSPSNTIEDNSQAGSRKGKRVDGKDYDRDTR